MTFFKRYPATLLLVLANLLAFLGSYLQVHSFAEPEWTLNLLRSGAEFNPLTLDKEWYRIFLHMFLHANIFHLAFNMYALFVAGGSLEQIAGTKKFLWIYFISGVASALSSLYWGLFTIGVGASGAIFGVFGASLVINIVEERKQGKAIGPVLTSFLVFLGINILFGAAIHADHAAHAGGFVAGIALTLLTLREGTWDVVKYEYLFLPGLVLIYFLLPRYQVTYFKFFEKVLTAEDSSQLIFEHKLSDEDFVKGLQRNNVAWDSAVAMLDRHAYLPNALRTDTFKLRKYIKLRKTENLFRIRMIEKESYVYLDSIEFAQELIAPLLRLDYPLLMLHTRPQKDAAPEKEEMKTIKVYFNSDWEEIPGPTASYYREGQRDSLGRWQGSVHDYYINGMVQMKGTYRDDRRNGVFLYYSDHNTYTSAGRYKDDRSVGKWEIYHGNGKIKTEEYFTPRFFLKNEWDSLGKLCVKDGDGKVTELNSAGVVVLQGEYKGGRKEGIWYGRRDDGTQYFEEFFNQGRLVSGRSKSRDGHIFVYDESIFFPIPPGGWVSLRRSLERELRRQFPTARGTVRLSFRVTPGGSLTDFKVDKSINRELDEKLEQLLQQGPSWIPAREHGQKPMDGFEFVEVAL